MHIPTFTSLISASAAVIFGCAAFAFGKRGGTRDAPDAEDEVAPTSALPEKGAVLSDQNRDRRLDSLEWRRVTEALRDSEEKYRVLVENANDAICVAQDGIVKFFNPKMRHMLGYSAEQLTTLPFTELIAVEDRPMVLDRYVRRLAGEDIPHQYEFRFLTAAGEPLWIEINSVMIQWDGRPASLCFFRDVNEQKRTEAALRDSEALYHSLVESLPLSIFRKDADGAIVFANRRFCENLGRTLDDLRGKTDFDLFPRELAEKYHRDDEHVLTTGRVMEDVEEHRRSDGELIYVQILKAPIRAPTARSAACRACFGTFPRGSASKKDCARTPSARD